MGRTLEPLFTVDDAGRVMSWSDAAARLFGRPAEGVLSRGAAEAVAGSGVSLRAVPRPGAEGWEVYASDADGAEPDMEGALVRALFAESQLGLIVLDRDLRLVRVSTAARAMYGRSPDELLGKRLDEAYDLENPARDLAAAREVLENGTPEFSRLVTAFTTVGPRRRQYYSVSAFRLRQPEGEPIGLALTLLDVSRRERGRERAAAVARVRELVGRSLQVMENCQDFADALVPGFADVALVALTEQVAGGDYPPLRPVETEKLLLRRAAFRTSGPADPDEGVGEVSPVGEEPAFNRALREQRPVLVQADADGDGLTDSPSRATALGQAGAHTMIVAPLTVRGRVLGLVRLLRCGDSEHFTKADLPAMEDAATHAALCLDNARRAAHDRALASTVHRKLLPKRPTPQLGIDTAYVALSPSSESRTWFDVTPLSGARCALAVGEVDGAGPHALATMGHLRTALRALADLELQPDELLARLGDAVTRLSEDRTTMDPNAPALTASCTFALYDPVTKACLVACAGQRGPRVIGPDGRMDRIDAPVGPRLGAPDTAPFAMAGRTLESGTTLILAGDDMDQALSTEVINRLLAVYDSAQDLADGLFTRLAASPRHTGTALLARTHELSADTTAVWDLPAEDRAASEARRLTRHWLNGLSHPVSEDSVDSAGLLVSELVTNAVRYGTPPITLRLILDQSLTVEVADSSPVTPDLRHARVTDEGGRGLFIVSQITHKWGTRRSSAGKTIWAEQPWTTAEES
ncbi:PAS domain-containing protein [Streptomyces sp. NPDC057137]|uniref:PAS domain-containing protein n=1 Tax=Streptomyces sp. NPDC057137 TaxID=3346030 RepID=UPI0036428287